MRSSHARIGLIALSALIGVAGAEPPRYTAIDITAWSAAQRASLPFFKHFAFMPEGLSGVPFGFVLSSRSSSGYYAGTTDQGIPYAGSEATLLSPAVGGGVEAAFIDPFGTYSWGYWSCDSTDCHYYFGYVRDSVASDVNWSGEMVGKATITGGGDYASGAVYHAYRYDEAGGRVDLFPAAGLSWAACINNRGQIGGFVSGVGAYRLSRGGTLEQLAPVAGSTPSPRWMNGEGVIIGARYPSRAFVAPGGAATVDLPDLGGFPVVVANDLNDSAWIVGKSGNFADPETYATIWEPLGDGTWEAFDLVEQLDTPDVLLESALVIDNAGHILASGHMDGTDLFGSRLFWLVPDQPLGGWCRPDIGVHPASTTAISSEAVFSVEVVNAGDVTGFAWRKNGIGIDAAQVPSAATATLVLTGLGVGDSGSVFDCVVTSACGETVSEPAVLTVEADCPADLTGDGILDLSDVNAFVSAFVGGGLLADLSGDGLLDLADIGLFVSGFVGGCP